MPRDVEHWFPIRVYDAAEFHLFPFQAPFLTPEEFRSGSDRWGFGGGGYGTPEGSMHIHLAEYEGNDIKLMSVYVLPAWLQFILETMRESGRDEVRSSIRGLIAEAREAIDPNHTIDDF